MFALIIAVCIYRNFSFRDLYETAYETVRTTAMLFMILAAAAMFGYVVTIMRLPNELVEAVLEVGASPITFIIAVMLVIFVLGMFPGYVIAKVLNGMGKLRIPREVEIAGLDYEMMESAKEDEKAVSSATR